MPCSAAYFSTLRSHASEILPYFCRLGLQRSIYQIGEFSLSSGGEEERRTSTSLCHEVPSLWLQAAMVKPLRLALNRLAMRIGVDCDNSDITTPSLEARISTISRRIAVSNQSDAMASCYQSICYCISMRCESEPRDKQLRGGYHATREMRYHRPRYVHELQPHVESEYTASITSDWLMEMVAQQDCLR